MNFYTVVVGVFLFICYNHVYGAALPEYIHICHRSDPEVEKCILNSIEELRPRLKSGIPELDVPALEPLILPVVKVSDDQSGFLAYGKNIKVYGASDFEITNLKLETATDNRLTVQIGLNIPHLKFNGDYEVNTRVLTVPINGNGVIRVNATNAKADMTVYGQIRKKGNHNYIRFTKIDMGLKLEDYAFHLDNLFGGDRVLGEATNRVLNENRKEIMKSINPIIIRTASEVILDVANKMAKNQPYDVLFPN